MSQACQRAIAERVSAIAFGDLFLQDIRAYREAQLQPTGLEPLFPLWNVPTNQLAQQMISGGLRAKIACVDSRQLDSSFAGREFNAEFLRDLPPSVDPCGENGEFHSCAYAGPMFSSPVPLEQGETVNRDGFIYSDFDLRASVLAG